MTRIRDERGSALVFIVFFMAALLGVCAFVIDVGSWFTAQRSLQAAADAATLAGAQDLPNTATASSTATSYANTNISGLNLWSPTFPDSSTIDVRVSKTVPGVFSKILSIDSVTVHAHARAQVGTPGSLRNAAPIGIKSSAACASNSSNCFGVSKTFTFDDTNTTTFGSNSTFGLLDLSGSSATSSSCTGNVGQSSQSDWITSGFPGLLSVGRYYGATTGQRTALRTALNTVVGKILLFPVFDVANLAWCGGGGGFHVVGWGAFIIDQQVQNSEWNPHTKTLHGHFIQYIAHDVVSTPGVPGFGVKVINLTQ
jgi:hypothetical protein